MDDIFDRYRNALRLGHHEAAEGRFSQALGYYQTAAELAGERALPHVGVGGMLLRLGRARDSLEAYDRALEREPANLDALSGRAAALLALGRRDEASRVHEQIAAVRRTGEAPATAGIAGDGTPMSRADVLHAAAQEAHRRGDVDAAIDAWLAESAEHSEAGHLDAALDASLRALSAAPAAVRIHLELARLYFGRGWLDRAVERMMLIDRLLALEPDPPIHAALVRLAAEHAADDERLAALSNRAG